MVDITKETKKNAYLYCKFRDEQLALYDEYAKRHGMLMKTLLVVNVLLMAYNHGREDRADFNSNRRFYRWASDFGEYLEGMADTEQQAEPNTIAELQ